MASHVQNFWLIYEPFLLEMNTVPGLTAESILPQQAKEAGISLNELFNNAIELAIKQKYFNEKSSISRVV